eukprot:9103999-Pyramimonas_sp.AAC.1
MRHPASQPHREIHKRPHWHRPHAPPPHSTALRGHRGSSSEGPSGTARTRPPLPSKALRDPTGSSTEGTSGTARMRHPPIQYSA